tara:strand:+ start:5180 stop:7909 length:2730 start_codon:yes stop_codon:yes gene_type:complete
MALKKLVTDLTQGLTAYPNHNNSSDTGGFNYGSSTSVFDTKTFNQRSISYTNPLSRQDNPSPLIPQILPGINEEPNNSILYLSDAPDGFIRGGAENSQKRAAYDTIRINKFFGTGGGLSFIATQKALQKTNPIIQEGGGNLNNVFEDVINSAVGTNFTTANTNRTFNEENLIKQISDGGYTGQYYNRAGSNPKIQSEVQNKYEASHKTGRKFDGNSIGDFNTQGGLVKGNRLISLGKKLDIGTGISFNLEGQESLMKQALGFDIGEAMDVFKDLKNGFNNFLNNPLETLSKPGPYSPNQNVGFQPGENIIYQYSGGPGSTYGIGDTILYRYEKTSGDFDHQGHPLSFSSYFENQITTVGSNNISFFKDGEFNSSAGLDFLSNTVNDSLFGGNNIVGKGGLLFDENGFDNSLGSTLEGLGNQFFGEDTVNFVKDIFDGGGMGNPKPGLGKQVKYGSYLIGGHNTIGSLHAGYLDIAWFNFVDGQPKPGFIASKRSNTGDGSDNKPDDIKERLEKGEEPSEGLGRIITFQSILNQTLDENVYKPSPSQMSKDGRKFLKEEGADQGVSQTYSGNHDYSQHLSTKVNSDGGSTRNYTRESRVNMGDPGAVADTTTLINGFAANKIDLINALDIHTKSGDGFGDIKYRDLVKFRFEAINTDTPSKSEVMAFRALLDGFNDNYSSTWNEFNYNGRGESFYTYNSFKRSFDISFKIAAQSEAEMHPLYRKLNYLVSTLAPDYGEGSRMRGNYIKLTMGDYMDRVPGFLTSVSIKWQTDYPWEIAITKPEDKNTKEILPHVLDVSCQFTPIHNFVPKKSKDSSPFIFSKNSSYLKKSDTIRTTTDEGSVVKDEQATATIEDSGENFMISSEYRTMYSIGKNSLTLFGREIYYNDIKTLNQDLDPYSLRIGQIIKIPK